MKEFWNYMLDSILNLVNALVIDFWEMLSDLVFFVFDELMSLFAWASSLILTDIPDLKLDDYWKLVPGQFIQVLQYVDFGQCIGLIVLALSLRFALNFIPFVK